MYSEIPSSVLNGLSDHSNHKSIVSTSRIKIYQLGNSVSQIDGGVWLTVWFTAWLTAISELTYFGVYTLKVLVISIIAT